MTVPAPSAQIQGQGVVTADNLNTYVQTIATLAQLRSFVGLPNMQISLQGYSTPGDGGQGTFYWNPSTIGPDNGTTIIIPSAAAVGGWVRIGASLTIGELSIIPTIPAFQGASIDSSVSVVELLGYYTVGDDGGGFYIRSTAGSGPGKVQSGDGQWWIYTPDFNGFNPLSLGAIGNGLADDTSPINSAISLSPYNGSVPLNEGKVFKVTTLTNPAGIAFAGSGQIITPAAGVGGTYQLNDYARYKTFVVGSEYRFRLFTRLGIPGTTLTGFVYGDSTVATAANGGGYAGPTGVPSILMANMFARRNVRNPISIVDQGVGGTGWPSLNAIPDLSNNSDIIFIKYGINDASLGLPALVSNMRAKLSAIRSSPFGGQTELTIVLVGPNSTWVPSDGRDSQWYEQIRGIYAECAREFQCVYVDLYGMFQDSTWMAGLMESNDYSNGQGIHPLAVFQQLLWAKVADAVIGQDENQLNINDTWTNLTLLNSWTSVGGAYSPPGCSISPDGFVSLRGMVMGGTPTSGQAIAGLPNSFYYPITTAGVFPAAKSGGGVCGLYVDPSTGHIIQNDALANATFTSLDGIRFSVR